MASENSYMLTYTQDVDKVTFNFYGLDINLIPPLMKQLSMHHMMENERLCRPSFKDERYLNAIRNGLSPEGQMSLVLKLKKLND